MCRRTEVERRIGTLIRRFEEYAIMFDRQPVFSRVGQQEHHTRAIHMRRQLGSAAAALRSDEFLDHLRLTVQAWGIGARGSVLVNTGMFRDALREHTNEIVELDRLCIDQVGPDAPVLGSRLWRTISSLRIVGNGAKLVSSTKALHHLLPDLIVPMDRKFTRAFFAWHAPDFQYQQERIFLDAFDSFVRVARAVNPAQYETGKGWRTSRTKMIDNALIGYCTAERIPLPS